MLITLVIFFLLKVPHLINDLTIGTVDLPNSVKENILNVPGVEEVELKLVWEPPWTKDKMSEVAKLELNL